MAKRFLYVGVGFLCLVCAYQLGAGRAGAEWDTGAQGAIVGGAGQTYYSRSGEAWGVSVAYGWQRAIEFDLPVEAGLVKFLDDGPEGTYLITTDDEAWIRTGAGWQHIGPFPGGPVPLKTESWGKVKDRYRD
jgi:hypothetical protein